MYTQQCVLISPKLFSNINLLSINIYKIDYNYIIFYLSTIIKLQSLLVQSIPFLCFIDVNKKENVIAIYVIK